MPVLGDVLERADGQAADAYRDRRDELLRGLIGRAGRKGVALAPFIGIGYTIFGSSSFFELDDAMNGGRGHFSCFIVQPSTPKRMNTVRRSGVTT